MQLKRPPTPLHLGLMAASCALLHGTARAQAASEDAAEQPLQIDTDLLYYQENAGRVRTIEPVVSLKKDFGDQRVLDGTVTIDSLSGATPNGAIPARTPQTFASPSSTSLTPKPGYKTTLYTIAPGALPQDPHFKEQRVAGDVGWSQPIGLDNTLSYGGHASTEHDFDSVAAHAGYSHDFNGKNTTLSAGVNEEYDRIHAHGGNPVAGSDYALYEKEPSQTRNVAGGLIGVTQVMRRNWLTELNYAFDHSQGYLTDPYRIISLVDATGAVTGYRYENRPDTRTRQSLYWVNKVALGPTVLDLSYRRSKDSWGIGSDTVDAKLRIDLGSGMYLEPHARWYHQSAADFYNLYLIETAAAPAYMSADPRLGAFTATTFGLKFAVATGRNGELSLRLEQYEQKATDQASSLTELQGLDLNPNLKATIVQLSWHFEY
jgi:Protein of unknown function (DUF3570)